MCATVAAISRRAAARCSSSIRPRPLISTAESLRHLSVLTYAVSSQSAIGPCPPATLCPPLTLTPTPLPLLNQPLGRRYFGRKGGKMGHHLQNLDEQAHRGEREAAKERRKNKKGKKGGGGGDDDDRAAASAARPTASSLSMETDLYVEADASETKFESDVEDTDDDVPSLPDVDDVRKRMVRVVDATEESFRKVRGAEPTPELFENIQVRAYGALAPLSSVAQVIIAGPTMATLTCYDPETAGAVRDAVRDAGLNFNPRIDDGGTVMCPIPKVSMETRQSLVKQLGKAAEASKQRVRRIRRAAQDIVKKGKDGKLDGVSKDDAFRVGKDIDAVTEETVAMLNGVFEKKQESIMAV